MNKSYNILICPLEWGLGHAARMIPVARRLREMNQNVIIASGEEHLSLFRIELPGLRYIFFPGFKPRYSGFLPQYLSILLQIPVLIFHIVSEHFRIKKILKENDIDIIISDNRFGLWTRKTTCVYITHMPRIPFPKPFIFLEWIGVAIHRFIINKYSFCFIPDLPGELNLSGKLSHNIKLPDNCRFIGILSRFISSGHLKEGNHGKETYTTVILSGPEPQKEILKQKLIAILKDQGIRTVMFEGKPGRIGETARKNNIIFYSHLSGFRMQKIIENSENVISRSGYTTVMELVSLNCSALIVPTPGQTEQEYLAKYLSEKGWFSTVSQNGLKDGIFHYPVKCRWQGEIIDQSKMILDEALKEVLEKHHKEY